MLTLDSSKSVTVYQTLQKFNQEELQILRKFALAMDDFSENGFRIAFNLFEYEPAFTTSFLKKSEDAGVIKRIGRPFGNYRMQPLFQLALLIDFARNPDRKTTEVMERGYDSPETEDFINEFSRFIGSATPWRFREEYVLIPELFTLLYYFPFFEELVPVYEQFSPRLKSLLWDNYMREQLYALRPVNHSWKAKYITPFLSGPDSERNASEAEILFDEILPLSLCRGQVCPPQRTGLSSAEGILNLCRGQFAESAALFEESVKHYNRLHPEAKKSFPVNPIYSVAYVSALINEGSEKSKKKIATLLKKKELKEENVFFPVYLLLSAASESAFTGDINRTAVYRADTALTALIYALVARNYELEVQQVDLLDEALFLMRQDGFRFLWKEAARYFPDLSDELSLTPEQTALGPLLPSYRKPKPWELILTKLLEDPAVAPAAGGAGATSPDSRIVYLISRNFEVTPILQKSKEGQIWKGGRKIALKTFAEGVPEMNDSDKLIAATVRKYPARWGSYEYMLGGYRTLAALVGNPLVFLYSNPDIPVEISRMTPYISVSRGEKGFLLETNVEHPTGIEPVQVVRQSDTRINVMEFTPQQIRILEQLFRFPEYPFEAEKLLRELLGRISGEITIHSDLIDQEQSTKQTEGNAEPVVQILPLGECYKVELFVKPLGNMPPYCKPGIGNRSVMGKADGTTIQAIRNFRKETEMAEAVRQIFREFDEDASDILSIESMVDCLELLDQLHQQEEVHIEWPEEEKLKIRRSVSSSGFSISVRGNNTWFEIDGSLRISKNEEIHILELMKKVRESEGRFIRLEGNRYVALTTELRRQLVELSSILWQQKDTLQLSGFAVPLLEGLEKGGVEIRKDEAYLQLTDRIRNAGRVAAEIPAGLQADLREYQEEGFRWMSRLADWGSGACLADDMGLGKTLQAIAMLLSRAAQGPSLVIVPASVLANWENEIDRFAPALTVKNLNMPGVQRDALLKGAEAWDVVITTYGLLVAEEEILTAKEWNVVVLDEAHTIKNRETKMSKAAMKLKAGFRLILTGTPVQNHLSEIWNLFQFINPGLLGSFRLFTERFIMPIELREDKKQQQLLKKILSPFILRRTKNEVLDELPGKTEILQLVDLSAEELKLYESLRRQAEMSLQKKDLNAVKTLAEITRLRQAACHQALIYPDYEGSSSKMSVFMELVHELIENKHRALVFSQFTSHLALLKKELDRYKIDYLYLDGSTPTRQRSDLVKDFQTGDQPLFLISLKAGGLGLNLTAADYIIHLDPWWNPAVEDQASDRAYRIGQTRPVTVYRLIARHTIEEKIIRLHHTKKDLADSLLEGSNISAGLTREEMLELIRKI